MRGGALKYRVSLGGERLSNSCISVVSMSVSVVCRSEPPFEGESAVVVFQ